MRSNPNVTQTNTFKRFRHFTYRIVATALPSRYIYHIACVVMYCNSVDQVLLNLEILTLENPELTHIRIQTSANDFRPTQMGCAR